MPYKDKDKQRRAVKEAVTKHRQGTTRVLQPQLNLALARALLDPVKEARLRSICYRLAEKGKTMDYIANKEVSYLDLVTYGTQGTPFSVIAGLLNVSVK